MKTLRLKCCICGRVKTFVGIDAAIIRSIDAAKWTDRPDNETTCESPACNEQYEQSLDY